MRSPLALALMQALTLAGSAVPPEAKREARPAPPADAGPRPKPYTPDRRLSPEEALAEPCTRCGAERGSPCRTRGGRVRSPHPARYQRAART